METPAQITFRNFDHSDAVEARVKEEIDKLEQFYDRITSCRVILERPQRRHVKGDTYAVRINVQIPGAADVTVNRDPGQNHAHEDVFIAIRDSFAAARRQLQDLSRVRQGQVKRHDEPLIGRIATLEGDRDHGFISVDDGRLIYFHRNSVDAGGFDELAVGQAVRFSEDRGDKGPQASFVKPL